MNGDLDLSGGIVRPQQQNDLKDMIEEINSDTIDTAGFSKIDMRSRLSASEIPAILALDIAVSMGALPKDCSKLTRSKKRLAVSIRGKGREEMVQMATSEMNKKSEMVSMLDKMKGNV